MMRTKETVEWATPSPPPFYCFPSIPKVTGRDAFWEMKKHGPMKKHYEEIELPRNTGMGIYISAFGFLAGFGLVWEIYWLILLGLAGVIACLIVRSLDRNTEYTLSAEKVKELDEAYEKKHRG